MTQPPNQSGPTDPYGQPYPQPSYQQQPYPQQPYGQQPGAMPPGMKPRRRRPHLLWWLLPLSFFVAAVLMFVLPVVSMAQAFTDPAAKVSAGTDVPLTLPDGGLHFVFTDSRNESDAKGCVLTDSSGKTYRMQNESAPGQQAPEGLAVVGAFEADAGEYTATCPVKGADYTISVTRGINAGQVGMMALSLLVGLIGLILLIILAVLAITGASRKQPRYPSY